MGKICLLENQKQATMNLVGKKGHTDDGQAYIRQEVFFND